MSYNPKEKAVLSHQFRQISAAQTHHIQNKLLWHCPFTYANPCRYSFRLNSLLLSLQNFIWVSLIFVIYSFHSSQSLFCKRAFDLFFFFGYFNWVLGLLGTVYWESMMSFKEFWTKKTLVGLGLGQFLSLLITSTGFASSELARKGSFSLSLLLYGVVF